MNIFDLSDKTALVTGASSGLGWRFCEVLAAAGAHVIAAARRVDKLNELVSSIKQAGGSAESLKLDVRNFEQVKKQISGLNQHIDICINNAGIAIDTPIFEDNQNNFESVMQTNVLGVWYVTQVVAGIMKDQKIDGSIINISSIYGHSRLEEKQSAYCASKAAVSQLTKSLVGELSKFSIRINAIAPGAILTPMTPKWDHNNIPVGFLAEPSDLDGALLFLASNKASRYVTGSCITVDGGISWGGIE